MMDLTKSLYGKDGVSLLILPDSFLYGDIVFYKKDNSYISEDGEYCCYTYCQTRHDGVEIRNIGPVRLNRYMGFIEIPICKLEKTMMINDVEYTLSVDTSKSNEEYQYIGTRGTVMITIPVITENGGSMAFVDYCNSRVRCMLEFS